MMEVGGSDSGVEPTPDSSLTSEREICDGTSEGGSESSGGGTGGRRPPRTPRTPLSRSVSVRTTPTSTRTTPVSDGRWPSNTRRGAPIMTMSMGGTPDKTTPDKYSTVPRRRRKSAENLSKSREPSLNRTASLRRKKVEENSAAVALKTAGGGMKKTRARTRIYHETGSQTGLTGADIEAGLGGRLGDLAARPQLVSVGLQAEGVCKLEKERKILEERVNRLNEEKTELNEGLVKMKEENERQEKKIRNILGLSEEGDLIECVDKERKKINDIVKKQQIELNQQHTLCCNLKKELERCMITERRLLEEQRETEAESLEIQEFLQAEKSTMADTLKELEAELADAKKAVSTAEAELAKQREECTHLVRMCEQRRQEKLSLESRLRTLELRSKETMLEQGAAVSGAAVALTGLGTRLDLLVSNLVASYNISPADLEDVIYHNEAFNESSSSGAGSSGELSPEVEEKKLPDSRPSGGLLSAIINAIRSATHRATPDVFPEPELLSAVSEPIQTAPNEKRFSLTSLPDLSPVKSQRASIATSDDFDLSVSGGSGGLGNSESLQNLSDAIHRRQREEEESMLAVRTSCEGSGIVDQVIEVDNLVTRLLRVLQIIETSRQTTLDTTEQDTKKSNDIIESLRDEIDQLKNKLNCTEKSSLQVESLQMELKEKEKELVEVEKKFDLTEELLTSNWHKAMSEVRRLYDTIDAALEMMQSCETEVEGSIILAQVRRNLEESNFRCATSLPVSTSRPDLNANAAPPTSNGRG